MWEAKINMLKFHEKLLGRLVREPLEEKPTLSPEMYTEPAWRCDCRWYVTVSKVSNIQ